MLVVSKARGLISSRTRHWQRATPAGCRATDSDISTIASSSADCGAQSPSVNRIIGSVESSCQVTSTPSPCNSRVISRANSASGSKLSSSTARDRASGGCSAGTKERGAGALPSVAAPGRRGQAGACAVPGLRAGSLLDCAVIVHRPLPPRSVAAPIRSMHPLRGPGAFFETARTMLGIFGPGSANGAVVTCRVDTINMRIIARP